MKMFGVQKFRMEKAPKQKGDIDSGLFAIAIATALAHFGLHGAMGYTSFNQCGMRDHLLMCFENMCLTPFRQLQYHAYYIILWFNITTNFDIYQHYFHFSTNSLLNLMLG